MTILENLSEKEIAKFSVHQYQFPGTILSFTSLKRFYPNGEVLTHVLGYVAHIINDSDLRKLEEQGKEANYQATTIIGKLGSRTLLRICCMAQRLSRVEMCPRPRRKDDQIRSPVAGRTSCLTSDLDLQKYVFKQLNHRTGSANILDPKTTVYWRWRQAQVTTPTFSSMAFQVRIIELY
ncbi:hypothetical protein O9929_25560 [Vibrio lentus]|nr:hypothetical protein [Vibrio lentus]